VLRVELCGVEWCRVGTGEGVEGSWTCVVGGDGREMRCGTGRARGEERWGGGACQEFDDDECVDHM
jgi:hypothetical protein